MRHSWFLQWLLLTASAYPCRPPPQTSRDRVLHRTTTNTWATTRRSSPVFNMPLVHSSREFTERHIALCSAVAPLLILCNFVDTARNPAHGYGSDPCTRPTEMIFADHFYNICCQLYLLFRLERRNVPLKHSFGPRRLCAQHLDHDFYSLCYLLPGQDWCHDISARTCIELKRLGHFFSPGTTADADQADLRHSNCLAREVLKSCSALKHSFVESFGWDYPVCQDPF